MPLRTQAERDIAAGRSVSGALAEQVHELVRMTSRNRVLSGAFFAACQEYADTVHAPPQPDDELDPRVIAPLPDAIRLLVEHGQATRQLRGYPAAVDISTMIVNVVLLRGVEAPDERAEVTEGLVRTVLFGTLHPELLLDHRPAHRAEMGPPAG